MNRDDQDHCEEAVPVAKCDYWWIAGGVEWCDMVEGQCRCGGWEKSCGLRDGRRHEVREPTPAHLRRALHGKKLAKGHGHGFVDPFE